MVVRTDWFTGVAFLFGLILGFYLCGQKVELVEIVDKIIDWLSRLTG